MLTSRKFIHLNSGSFKSFFGGVSSRDFFGPKDSPHSGDLWFDFLDKAKQKDWKWELSKWRWILGSCFPTIDMAVSMREISLKEEDYFADELYSRPKPLGISRRHDSLRRSRACISSFNYILCARITSIWSCFPWIWVWVWEIMAVIAKILAKLVYHPSRTVWRNIADAFNAKPDWQTCCYHLLLWKSSGDTSGCWALVAYAATKWVPVPRASFALELFRCHIIFQTSPHIMPSSERRRA